MELEKQGELTNGFLLSIGHPQGGVKVSIYGDLVIISNPDGSGELVRVPYSLCASKEKVKALVALMLTPSPANFKSGKPQDAL